MMDSTTLPPPGMAPHLRATPVGEQQRGTQAFALGVLAFACAYLAWRAAFTINPDAPVLSWSLWALEAHLVLGLAVATFNLWDPRPLRPASDALPEGTVAVCIATYNEPTEILLPVIAAAVAVEGPHETWVLDDGARPEVRELATRLGARYLDRPDNRHAKAGNLNHALTVIDVDFLLVLDADHVPHPDFLRRTLPYFNDPQLALVQTPQDFYNEDSFEHVQRRRRRRDAQLTEQSMFYGVVQPAKNRWGSAFWCGTNAVVRTTALRQVGGVATESVTEDLHTTIRLHRAGWTTVFHDETLARGLAPPTAAEYLLQRRRWCIGGIQTLRMERPLLDRDLTWAQRLSYTATLIFWFDALRVLALLLVPPLVILGGTPPIIGEPALILGAFLAFAVLQQLALRRLAHGRLLGPVAVMMFELIRLETTLLALLVGGSGRAVAFAVTPKGRTGADDRRVRAPGLLRGLLALYAACAVWYLASIFEVGGLGYAAPAAAHAAMIWLLLAGFVLLRAVTRIRSTAFAAERRRSHRHDRELLARIAGQPALVADLSLTGARLELLVEGHPPLPVGALLDLEILHERGDATLRSAVVASGTRDGRCTAGVDFAPGQVEALATLTLGLFHPASALADASAAARERDGRSAGGGSAGGGSGAAAVPLAAE